MASNESQPWNLPCWPKFGKTFWADAAKGKADSFAPSRAAEQAYERQIVSVAKRIEAITKNGQGPAEEEKALKDYAELIEPWARQSATNMLLGVRRKNDQAWQSLGKRMGMDMRMLLSAPGVGMAVQASINANILKIKSLALGAAEEVGKMARESLVTGERAEDMAKRIAHIGEVSLSEARTIAHTEVSKAGTALTMARAESIGSDGYIWRTARDGSTRASHRAMEGVFVKWAEIPIIDGMKGHAGEFPNCRCYPEPVVPRADGNGNYKTPLPIKTENEYSGGDPNQLVNTPPAVLEPDPIRDSIGIHRGDPIEPLAAAGHANPQYATGEEYKVNCQRCVPTYELRRRGYDVQAMPNFKNGKGYYGPEGFKAPQVQGVYGGGPKIGKKEMLKKLNEMPEGGRAGVIWVWPGRKSGHTIVCEKINGKLVFIDPQNGSLDIGLPNTISIKSGYSFYRMDTLELRDDFDWSLFVKG